MTALAMTLLCSSIANASTNSLLTSTGESIEQMTNSLQELAAVTGESFVGRKAGDPGKLTVLGCAGIKLAFVMKRSGSICVDRFGEAFHVGASGLGLSIGLSADAFLMIIKGDLSESIRGTYRGLGLSKAKVSLSQLLRASPKLLKMFPKLIAPEISLFRKYPLDNASLIIIGAQIGPMWDLSSDILAVEPLLPLVR